MLFCNFQGGGRIPVGISWEYITFLEMSGDLLYGVVTKGLTCTAVTGMNKNAPPTGVIISTPCMGKVDFNTSSFFHSMLPATAHSQYV